MKLERLLRWSRRTLDHPEKLRFTCNICGGQSTVLRSELQRESNSCSGCLSTVRWRSVVAALSTSLFGASLPFPRFPFRRDIVGLGMSDWEGYAEPLGRIFEYQNTFYDEPPQFDVMAPVPPERKGSYDFIISSDVLEHVAPPYQEALAHMRQLLKPGGTLVLTVPLKANGPTDEHFPNLHQYSITIVGDTHVLVNRTRDGALEVYENLVFHGGPGATLEMRLVSLPDLLTSLQRVGFVDIRPFDTPLPDQGIIWNDPCGCPIMAKAPS